MNWREYFDENKEEEQKKEYRHSKTKDNLLKIDTSKLDRSLENLVLAIKEYHEKNNIRKNNDVLDDEKNKRTKHIKKKLNVDLIRKVILETRELQQKKNVK